MDGSPLQYHDPQGDKIRGSIKGMVKFYRQYAKLKTMKAEILRSRDESDMDQTTRMQEVDDQIADMEKMRKSDIRFNIKIGKVSSARGGNHDSKVTVNQRGIHRALGRAGRVDIVLDDTAPDNSAGLGQAVAISALFLGSSYSFTNQMPHRGDSRTPRNSQEMGVLLDQGDARKIEGAKLLWLYTAETEGERQTALSNYAQSDEVQSLDDYDRSLDSTRPGEELTFEQEMVRSRLNEWVVKNDKVVQTKDGDK
jgi:hypothetical protein